MVGEGLEARAATEGGSRRAGEHPAATAASRALGEQHRLQARLQAVGVVGRVRRAEEEAPEQAVAFLADFQPFLARQLQNRIAGDAGQDRAG